MKLYRPVSFVEAVRSVLVERSINLISAPTSTAPCWSVTCPEIVPLAADCASAGVAVKLAASTKRKESRTRMSLRLPTIDFSWLKKRLYENDRVRDVRAIIHAGTIVSRGLS